jgi:hypothetical protein
MLSVDPARIRFGMLPKLADVYKMFRAEEYAFRLVTTYMLPDYVKEIDSYYNLDVKYRESLETLDCSAWLLQPRWLEQELRRNSILGNVLGNIMDTSDLRFLLAPLAQHYLRNNLYRTCAEVYSIDIMAKKGGKYPIVLYEASFEKLGTVRQYLGHVYCHNYMESGNLVCVGLRESLKCVLEKIYSIESTYRGVSMALLDECRIHALEIGARSISLENLDSSLEHVSRKYGFVDGVLEL